MDVSNNRFIKLNQYSNETILKNLNLLIDSKYQSEPYNVKNTKKFEQIDISNIKDIDTIDYIMFKINKFYFYMTNNLNYTSECEEWLKKEIEYIFERNHCVFISIIIKFIIESITDYEVNFNQGYYSFKNNDFAKMLFGEMSSGFHSWCDINGAILDATFVIQQSSSYNGILKNTYFLGNQPKDIILVGYNEKDTIVFKYLKELLDINNFSYKEWLFKHIEFIDKLK